MLNIFKFLSNLENHICNFRENEINEGGVAAPRVSEGFQDKKYKKN